MTKREPGTVSVGEWAHVRWGGHHLVVADDDPTPAQSVRTACGRRFERSRVWHDPPPPYLDRCSRCIVSERKGVDHADA